MHVECRSVGKVQIAQFFGSLVGSEVAEIKQQLNQLITQHTPYLIIDLSTLNFIDVRGLATFVSALKRAQYYQGEVFLLNPTAKIRALIELTQLQYTFIIYLDENAAVAYCQQKSTSHIPQ